MARLRQHISPVLSLFLLHSVSPLILTCKPTAASTAAQSNDVSYVRKPSQWCSEELEKSGESRGLTSNLEIEAEKGKKSS